MGLRGSLEAALPLKASGWGGGQEKGRTRTQLLQQEEKQGVDLICISFLSLPHRLPQRRGIPNTRAPSPHAVGQKSCPAWPGSLPRAGMWLPCPPKAACSYETRHKLKWCEAKKQSLSICVFISPPLPHSVAPSFMLSTAPGRGLSVFPGTSGHLSLLGA